MHGQDDGGHCDEDEHSGDVKLQECIRTLPRGGMYWKIHSTRPTRFPPKGNLEGRGGVFSNASRLEAVYGHSFSISREVLILWCADGASISKALICQ